MRVRELMTGTPIMVGPDTSIFEAKARMTAERIRHLIVVAGADLVGIVTDRDIRLNLPSQATSLSVWEANYLLRRLPVGKVMSKSVIVIGPDREGHDAARLMIEHGIGALPVTDAGRVIGIITETDILRAFVRAGERLESLRR